MFIVFALEKVRIVFPVRSITSTFSIAWLKVISLFVGLGKKEMLSVSASNKEDSSIKEKIAVKEVSLVSAIVLGLSVFPSFQITNL
jgi:hypothetical protein